MGEIECSCRDENEHFGVDSVDVVKMLEKVLKNVGEGLEPIKSQHSHR